MCVGVIVINVETANANFYFRMNDLMCVGGIIYEINVQTMTAFIISSLTH